jgi:SAM-dependent methyltransferase
LDDAAITAALRSAIASPLGEKRRRAFALADGAGGERLSAGIMEHLRRYHGDEFPVASVTEEYESASTDPEEFRKLKWGSPEGMVNAFSLARTTVRWKTVRSWLDIGSGTGAFLREVEKDRIVERFLGLDLSPSLVRFARESGHKSPHAEFALGDFLEPSAGGTEEQFDLVTLIGVLQKCGASLRKGIGRAAERVRPGGQLFLTTKNLDWDRFRDPGFRPEADHHWFRVSEVESALKLAGMALLCLKAFEPRSGQAFAEPGASHSLFAWAEKPRS